MRRLLILGLLPLLFLPLALRGKGGTPFHFSAEVMKVIDGDTMEVRILESRGWPVPGEVEKLRLAGIDAFELSEARGVLAKVLVNSFCPPGERIYCRLKPGRARDPYGRILARVYLRGEGGWIDLGEELIRRELARRWED
jgi:endonuclease YncB( thermonuclease family)